MRISKISIAAPRTINLGNYESLQVRGECTIEIDENDLIEIARSRAIEDVKDQMQEAFAATKPKGK